MNGAHNVCQPGSQSAGSLMMGLRVRHGHGWGWGRKAQRQDVMKLSHSLKGSWPGKGLASR